MTTHNDDLKTRIAEAIRIIESGNLINPLTGNLSELRIEVIKQILSDLSNLLTPIVQDFMYDEEWEEFRMKYTHWMPLPPLPIRSEKA